MAGRDPKPRPRPPVEFVAVWSQQAAKWEVLNSRNGEAIKTAADEREAKDIARNLSRLYAADPGGLD
jgi:hypothetical protein